MGFALAEEFARSGCEVFLVSGPANIKPSRLIQHFYEVQTSDEMYKDCNKLFNHCDIAIFSAAVADYKPAQTSSQKIKSKRKDVDISLIKTVDIALELSKQKKKNQLTIGFALETEDEIIHAKEKMEKKNFDLIVLNSLQDKGAGFGYNTNKVTIIDRDNKMHKFGLKSKDEVASDILKMITEKIQ